MIAIPNIERPKLCKVGEKICFAWDDEKYRCRITEWKKPCPLIDIVTCGECKWCDDKGKGRALICTNPYIDMDIHPLDFCSYGERRTETLDERIKRGLKEWKEK